MNYQDIMIRNTYISHKNHSIVRDLILQVMPITTVYRQALSTLNPIIVQETFGGLCSLAKAGGEVRLLLCPQIIPGEIAESDEDYVDQVKALIRERICTALSRLSDLDLRILQEILKHHLTIRLCLTKENGNVYNNTGIMTDEDNYSFVFHGGLSAVLPEQYEQITVFRSWKAENLPYVNAEIKAFDLHWGQASEDTASYPFNSDLEQTINNLLEQRKKEAGTDVIKLFDYQKEAIDAWVANGYKGFYVMATGTGKTWTAIFSARKLMEKEKVLTVITAPYKHLIKQWGEDLKKAFPEAKLVYVSSENPGWATRIKQEIIHLKYSEHAQLIIISTIASFNMSKFNEAINTFQGKKLLIVDEAHRFTQRNDELHTQYPFMLGLSATPFRGKNADSGKELMDFFGGRVYNLPIEKALELRCLVPYYYHPIYVHSTEEEEAAFGKYTQKIISCFNSNGALINPDLLVTMLRARLRVISMAEEKLPKLDTFLSEHERFDHFVVYCGDGRIIEDDCTEKRHIGVVREMLDKHGYTAAQFTAQETMDERMKLINAFDQGTFSALAAIRCLDEGVNIPSIKSALILSSNDDYREFVQRRGRILRKHDSKTSAEIYDLIVLPSKDCPGIATIELRRFAEYAKLAINKGELETELNRLMGQYNLSPDAINVFEFEDEEREIDE